MKENRKSPNISRVVLWQQSNGANSDFSDRRRQKFHVNLAWMDRRKERKSRCKSTKIEIVSAGSRNVGYRKIEKKKTKTQDFFLEGFKAQSKKAKYHTGKGLKKMV